MTDNILAEITALYSRFKDIKPIEPIYLTEPQMELLRACIPTVPAQPSWCGGMAGLLDTPIYLVDTVEESTPYLKAWPGWPTELTNSTPGCGEPRPEGTVGRE